MAVPSAKRGKRLKSYGWPSPEPNSNCSAALANFAVVELVYHEYAE